MMKYIKHFITDIHISTLVYLLITSFNISKRKIIILHFVFLFEFFLFCEN